MNAIMGKRRRELHALIDFAGKYVYNSSDDDPEYDKICSEHIDSSIRSYFIKMTILCLSFTFAIMGPAYMYFTKGIIATTTELQIPFFVENSGGTLVANLSLQFMAAFHGIIAYIGFETMMSIFSDAVTIAPKIIKYKLTHLDSETSKKTPSEARINFMVNDIAKQSLEADE